MAYYSIYGVTFQSDIAFRSPLPLGIPPCTLSIIETDSLLPLDGAEWLTTVSEEYRSAINIETAYRLSEGDLLIFPDGDQTLVAPQQITYCHAGPERTRGDFVDVRILGTVFAWWLLQQARIPFHAGALVLDGEAVLFMAESGMGKSTLMTSLLAQGVPLLCDDFVAVQFSSGGQLVAASAYPQMRLWPQTIEQYIGDATPYLPVFDDGIKRRVPIGEAWGCFLPGQYPVTRIYLLQRETETKGHISVRRCTGHEAFMHLLSALLMSANVPVSDLQRSWPTLQTIAERTPIFELSYPTGWEWLPDLHRVIMEMPSEVEVYTLPDRMQ